MPLVIGHRGASDLAPENTLAAFDAAWSAGVQWIETDVQPTADLVPVLFHDDSLDRISSVIGKLRASRLTEVASLDAGSWFSRLRGAVDFSALRIPTMHEFLSALPPTGRVLLEIKGPHTDDELVIELAVIRATRTMDRVWLQSFELEVLSQLDVYIPNCWRGLLRDDVDPDPVALCREHALSSYHPERTALLARPEIVGQLHEAGISVVTFTANDEDDWDRLTALGVDGIITDRPAALLEWQQQR
ncbi:MAG: glycerophosphodiester phosphodiesterase family protein [Nakamurella sp.]